MVMYTNSHLVWQVWIRRFQLVGIHSSAEAKVSRGDKRVLNLSHLNLNWFFSPFLWLLISLVWSIQVCWYGVLYWFDNNLEFSKNIMYLINPCLGDSYGTLFLSHIAEDINDSPYFSGNVLTLPKVIFVQGFHISRATVFQHVCLVMRVWAVINK